MKVAVVYYSRTGKTEQMAEFIAEGVRFSGHEAEVLKISELKNAKDFAPFDAFIIGCPTYHGDMTENMKTFLFLAQQGGLAGKPGGAFGSHTHSGEAPGLIFNTMEFVFQMKMTNLGPFSLKEAVITERSSISACQAYGKSVAAMLQG